MAEKRHATTRVVASLRHNGKYHGKTAIYKLANLMGLDPSDLYHR